MAEALRFSEATSRSTGLGRSFEGRRAFDIKFSQSRRSRAVSCLHQSPQLIRRQEFFAGWCERRHQREERRGFGGCSPFFLISESEDILWRGR